MLCFSFHLPERFCPGNFDLFGHSHQPFHVFGALATYSQMWAIYTDMHQVRTVYPIRVDSADLGLFLLVALANVYVVYVVMDVLHPAKRGGLLGKVMADTQAMHDSAQHNGGLKTHST